MYVTDYLSIFFFSGTTSQSKDSVVSQLMTVCLSFLLKQVNSLTHQEYDLGDLHLLDNSHVTHNAIQETGQDFRIPPFSIPLGKQGVYIYSQFSMF